MKVEKKNIKKKYCKYVPTYVVRTTFIYNNNWVKKHTEEKRASSSQFTLQQKMDEFFLANTLIQGYSAKYNGRSYFHSRVVYPPHILMLGSSFDWVRDFDQNFIRLLLHTTCGNEFNFINFNFHLELESEIINFFN